MHLKDNNLKILYLVYFNLENTKMLGVKKKVIGQAEALRVLGFNVDIGYCKDNKLIICKDEKKEEYDCRKGISNYRKSLNKLLKEKNNDLYYNIVFLRFPDMIDYYLCKMASILKENNVQLLLEVPTYPIKGEMKNAIKKSLKNKNFAKFIKSISKYFIHNIYKNKLYKTGTKIVTYMPYKKIWKMDVIEIDNGIDIDSIKKVEKNDKKIDAFNILVVANLNKWHGVDRAIYGIKEYIKKHPDNKRKVKLVIAGNGAVKKELEEITRKEKLEDYISFIGVVDGNKLDDVYNQATIALGSLGLHRIGLEVGSTLKVKEYCAKGIPFVLGYKEKELDEKFKYALLVPANDEPLNIEECIKFYDEIKDFNYVDEMRKFAEDKYDWKIQMQKMIELL